MTFTWPEMLWLMLAIPLIVFLYVRLQQRRRQLAARYGSLGLVQSAGGRPAGVHRHVPMALFLAGLSILILALARPQAVVSMPRLEGTAILVFDVSGSMAAGDITPTRMDAAKAAAEEFVNHQPLSVLVGVVAFSDNGLSVQVPTNDKEAIFGAINRLAPARGTSLANGILAALKTIETAGKAPDTHYYSNLTPEPTSTPTPVPAGVHLPAVIILLTDGENNQSPDPLLAAREAAEHGVRIYTVGIGSPTGADLTIDGFIVHTQLNEDMLQQISQVSGGAYYNAQSEADLQNVYRRIDPQWVIKPEDMEITSLFAGASILILLAGGAFSLIWFSRLP